MTERATRDETAEAEALARRCAAAMFARDAASQSLGMEIVSAGPGRCVVKMPVRDDMINGHGTIHGGVTFALADSAFAFACNSRNVATVAHCCTISYLSPARRGDLLIAAATERTLVGRTGVYDIAITEEVSGRAIAEFRGQSRALRGEVLDPDGGPNETQHREQSDG